MISSNNIARSKCRENFSREREYIFQIHTTGDRMTWRINMHHQWWSTKHLCSL